MPKFEVTSPDGKTYDVNAPAGATQDDAIDYVQSNFYADKAASSKPNGIGRQLGLTGRHLIEGGLDTVGILSDPVAAIMRKAGIPAGNAHELGQNISNRLGLPSPRDRTERIVGDASRLMVGAGGFTGAAKNLAEKVISPVAKGVYGAISQAPAYQLASGAGAGLAGGTAREEGGGFGAQFGASLLGGLGAPLSLNAMLKSTSDLLKPAVGGRRSAFCEPTLATRGSTDF